MIFAIFAFFSCLFAFTFSLQDQNGIQNPLPTPDVIIPVPEKVESIYTPKFEKDSMFPTIIRFNYNFTNSVFEIPHKYINYTVPPFVHHRSANQSIFALYPQLIGGPANVELSFRLFTYHTNNTRFITIMQDCLFYNVNNGYGAAYSHNSYWFNQSPTYGNTYFGLKSSYPSPFAFDSKDTTPLSVSCLFNFTRTEY